ncbi:MAG: sugar phosphate nucleotidyltransferase [Candidatus Omnitrophota bacterium]
MKGIVGVVLAAGEGKRMKSAMPKVLHMLWGRPLLWYVLTALEEAGIEKIICVVGHKPELVKEYLAHFQKNSRTNLRIETVIQKELLGTADALYRTKKRLANFDGTIMAAYADAPLVKTETLRSLIALHIKEGVACSILSAHIKDPTGYGRIMRNDEGEVIKIVEEKEASLYQKVVSEINSGTYCFNAKKLFYVLDELMVKARKGEYYLTDTIELLKKHKERIATYVSDEPYEIIGINSRKDLSFAYDIMRNRILEQFMSKGITVIDPHTTFIDYNVRIGEETVIYPFVYIETDVTIGKYCSIGPFCRLRSGTVIEDNAKIGNFVEITRSHIKNKTKINHFSYIGDAFVGSNVNIGAGTITANYNGVAKNKTHIGNHAFIGSGTVLVAPVKIGNWAVTGAGCVVPKGKDVPDKTVVVGVPARVLKKRSYPR